MSFSPLDWAIVALYFGVLLLTSWWFSRRSITSSRDYFVTSMPMSAVAFSVLATSQSAATFLGVPEYSYRNDLTFLGYYASALLAAVVIAYVLLPRYYAMHAVTVYELLEARYGARAKQQAGVMFLIGRVLASGARLYIGAIAISMILFGDIAFLHVSIAVGLLLLGALAYTYFGGVASVILSDVLQAVTYIGAAVAVLLFLYHALGMEVSQILSALEEAEKLRLVDTSLEGKFGIWALLGGWTLLNIAAYGLDQDMTQRLLSCRNRGEAARSLLLSVIMTIPVVALFLAIGLLLYLFYAQQAVSTEFAGESVTIFMVYILNEMPEGMRALVTVGAIAAALSSTNSVLAAMASVAVEDLYRPWKAARSSVDETHYIKAARIAVVGFAVLLGAMALFSYVWQRSSDMGLVSFALGVMTFAYTGLLGVFGAALFTKRGSARTVPWALAGGFFTVLALQPYVFGLSVGFAWQMVAGTAVAFGVMALTKQTADRVQ